MFIEELVTTFDPENGTQLSENAPKITIVTRIIVCKESYKNHTHAGTMKVPDFLSKVQEIDRKLIFPNSRIHYYFKFCFTSFRLFS